MLNPRLYAFILFFLAFALFMDAQDQSQKFFRLDENDLETRADSGRAEVMAASRSLKKLEDLPVTAYVITRDEIISNGYTTLVDALVSLPGIRVSQPGSAIDGESFQIQGIYGNYYCKILVDGINITPSVVSGMAIGRQLPIRQAERIEVIFGPASSLYGAEALAGVINIVTHKSDRPVTAQADIALGSDGYEYLNVTIGGKVGKKKNVLNYSLYGGTYNQRDMRVKYDRDFLYNPSLYDSSYSYLQKPYFEGDSSSIIMNELPMSSRLLGFSLGWRGLTAQAMRMTRSAHTSIGRDPSTFAYYDPLNLWSESIQRYVLTYEKKWEKVSSNSNLTWLNYRLDNQTSFGLLVPVGETGNGYRYAASDDLMVEEHVTYLPIKGLELIGGLFYQYSGNLPLTNGLAKPFETDEYHPFSEDPVKDTSVFNGFGNNPLTFHRAGAFVQFFYEIRRFIILGGYRLDYYSMFDYTHSPRISAIYRTENSFSLRASVSTGTRVPSMFYMFSSGAVQSDGGIYYAVVPNPNLQPEKLVAAEVGFRWNRLSWLEFDAAIFYHRIHEQFTRSFVILDSTEYPLAVNTGRIATAYVNDENSMAELFGMQANVGFKRIIPSIGLEADLNLTISKGSEILPNDLGTINDYRQMPVCMGQLNISLRPHDRIRLLLKNNFSSGWVKGFLPLDPDILREIGYPIDIKGFYTLAVQARFVISKNFEAFAHFNNVTNAHYGGIDAYSDEYDLFYNPQYSFNFRFGLNFRME
jgi:hemoglobin/transferrin/lactoferrin receptor protein